VTDNASSAGSAAAQRLRRFQMRPDVQKVTGRHADWAQSDEGCIVNLQLASLALARVTRRISRQDYKRSVRILARSASLPVQDFLLIAKCCLEATQCMLAAIGQIPYTPAQWDIEDREP
jgi:hypothetical protein